MTGMPPTISIRRVGFTQVTTGEDLHGGPVVNVIFVHGLRGSPLTTWTAKTNRTTQNQKLQKPSKPPEPAKEESKKGWRLRSLLNPRSPRSNSEEQSSTEIVAPQFAETSFVSTERSFCWPVDALPQKIPNARIYLYGYEADVIAPFKARSKNTITNHSNDFLVALERDIPEDKPIIFVAHSLGGILVKDVVVQSKSHLLFQYQSIYQRTKCIVFMGTPHRGSSLGGLAEVLGNITKAVLQDPNNELLHGLDEGSEILDRIHSEFMKLVTTPALRVHCFQEDRGVTGVLGLGRQVVDYQSSKTGSPYEVTETLAADHINMVKYAGAYDENYEKVSNALGRYVQSIGSASAPQRTQRAFQPRTVEKAIDAPWTRPKVVDDQGVTRRHGEETHMARVTDIQGNGVLQSLAFREMHSRRLDLEPRHQHTCQWILETVQYKEWISTSRGLFWIKGKPGAGKSTVMAFLYDEMQRKLRSNLHETFRIQLSFFMSARGTKLQHTFQGLLRSLLHQLCVQDKTTLQHIHTIFKGRNQSFGNSPGGWEWRLSELKSLFTESVVSVGQSRSLILFVDALDEAGEQQARQMAQFLHQLSDQAVSAQASIAICISCRHYPIVSSKGTNFEVVVEQHNNRDIAAYIHDTLCLDQVINHGPGEDQTWGELELELNKRAQGTFQWAHLVVPLVQRRIDKGQPPLWITQRLQSVPDELRDVYTHILRDVIDEEDRSLSFCLFQWVCLAAEPLTVIEMRHALEHTNNPHAHNVVDTDERMRLRTKSLSGGLIEVARRSTYSQECVQVCHQSVNEFMLAEGLTLLASLDANLNMLNPTATPTLSAHSIVPYCHSRLYWTCLAYLASDVFMEKVIYKYWSYADRQELVMSLPFIEYATLNIFFHAEKSGLYRSDDLSKEIAILQWIFPKFIDLYRKFSLHRQDIPEETQLLHFASRVNLTDIVEHLLQHSCDVHLKDGNGRTALHYAAQHDHQALASLLAGSGADVNSADEEGRTVLVHATSRGQLSMAQWLLEHGAQIMPGAERDSNAFQEAASIGNVELIKLFLAKGAGANGRVGTDAGPLHLASLGGHEKVVRLLLDAGAEVDMSSDYWGSPLQAASSGGHEEVVKILLDAKTNVNGQGGRIGTALQAASLGGHEQTVRLLLDAGAEVNLQGGHYGNALQAASCHRSSMIVKMLLKAGAAVNMQGGCYGNALQAASVQGDANLVQTLLERGAAVNAEGGRYGTALQAASAECYEQIVQMLLNAGADTSLKGGFYGNALRAAAVRGHENILILLVEKSSHRHLIHEEKPLMAFKHLF